MSERTATRPVGGGSSTGFSLPPSSPSLLPLFRECASARPSPSVAALPPLPLSSRPVSPLLFSQAYSPHGWRNRTEWRRGPCLGGKEETAIPSDEERREEDRQKPTWAPACRSRTPSRGQDPNTASSPPPPPFPILAGEGKREKRDSWIHMREEEMPPRRASVSSASSSPPPFSSSPPSALLESTPFRTPSPEPLPSSSFFPTSFFAASGVRFLHRTTTRTARKRRRRRNLTSRGRVVRQRRKSASSQRRCTGGACRSLPFLRKRLPSR